MKRLTLLAVGLLAIAGCHSGEDPQRPKERWQTPAPFSGLFGVVIGKPIPFPDCPRQYGEFDFVMDTCKTKDKVFIEKGAAPNFLGGNHIDVSRYPNGNARKIEADFSRFYLNEAKEALLTKFGVPDITLSSSLIWRYSDFNIAYNFDDESGHVVMRPKADADAEIDAYMKSKEAEQNKM